MRLFSKNTSEEKKRSWWCVVFQKLTAVPLLNEISVERLWSTPRDDADGLEKTVVWISKASAVVTSDRRSKREYREFQFAAFFGRERRLLLIFCIVDVYRWKADDSPNWVIVSMLDKRDKRWNLIFYLTDDIRLLRCIARSFCAAPGPLEGEVLRWKGNVFLVLDQMATSVVNLLSPRALDESDELASMLESLPSYSPVPSNPDDPTVFADEDDPPMGLIDFIRRKTLSEDGDNDEQSSSAVSRTSAMFFLGLHRYVYQWSLDRDRGTRGNNELRHGVDLHIGLASRQWTFQWSEWRRTR